MQYFLKQLDADLNHILFNTLATPFLVSFNLPAKSGQDVLIWQEPLADDIPGNMQLILEDNDLRADTVVISNRATYERALELTPASTTRFSHLVTITSLNEIIMCVRML